MPLTFYSLSLHQGARSELGFTSIHKDVATFLASAAEADQPAYETIQGITPLTLTQSIINLFASFSSSLCPLLFSLLPAILLFHPSIPPSLHSSFPTISPSLLPLFPPSPLSLFPLLPSFLLTAMVFDITTQKFGSTPPGLSDKTTDVVNKLRLLAEQEEGGKIGLASLKQQLPNAALAHFLFGAAVAEGLAADTDGGGEGEQEEVAPGE